MTFSQIRQYITGVLSNIFNKTLSNIAPKFDPNKNYSIGDIVTYNGDLYRFTSAHTGAWVAADASKTNVDALMERMPSTDMEEVASPLPGVMSRRMKYSLQEQVIGEWIDGKPLYQKTFNLGNLPNRSTKTVAHNISNIDIIFLKDGFLWDDSAGVARVLPFVHDTEISNVAFYVNKTNMVIESRSFDWSSLIAYVTLQYTKTTDTAV